MNNNLTAPLSVEAEQLSPPEGTRRALRAMPRLASLLVLLASFLGLTLLTSGPASAGSNACATYGQGIGGYARNGSMCSQLSGSGTWISSVSANFGTTVPYLDRVCNAQLKVDVHAWNGSRLRSWTGSPLWGCTWGGWNYPPGVPIFQDMSGANGGYARVTLLSYGSPVVSTVHGIRR